MSVKKAPMNVYGARTIGICAACVGMLLSVPVHALSLGGIQVKSALDEPLRAEITLKSADAETLESLEVTLGSREDFGRADVPRSEFLQQLQFEVVTEGGKPMVRVSTEQAVKEPFLHFLIAAEWSGGKLVREYTGLLDPPLYTADSPASVAAPATTESMDDTASSTSQDTSEMASGETTQEPAVATSSTTMSAAPGRSAEYGPTQEGDTLWNIASKLQTGALNVNVFQVMIALLRENPDAFIDNNINRLKTGQLLSIQDLGDIANVSPNEASTVYAAQLEDWQSYRSSVAGAGEEVEMPGDGASDAMTTASTTDQAAGDTADTAANDGAAESDQTPETAQADAQQTGQEGSDDEVLRIVQATLDESQQSETAGAGADRSGEIAELRGQIATLEESLESRNLANQELQERVRLLEGQLENAQRLIEIESEELAAAQAQAAEREAAMAEELATAEAQAMEQEATAREMEPETEQVVDSGDQMAESESEVSAAGADSSAGEDAQAAGTGTQESTQPDQETTATQQASAAATTANPDSAQSTQETQKVRKVANRPPQSSWWSSLPDMLFASWMWMVGAGVGVLVLVLGLLMFLRRRQSIAEFEESILSGSALDSYSETTDTAGSSASDTSFLSDFGTAGMGTMQADEVDPLAEAEVYLAYGRDEQAEEVLKEAARRDPDRSEIKLKLLEIYKQRNDVKSFETIAEELYPASEQEDPEIWRRVNAMGRELSPGNPLFQESEAETTVDTGAATPAAAVTAPRAAAPAEREEVDTLNFDLDDFGGDDAQTPAGVESVEQSVETKGLDMDLDTESKPAPPETVARSDGNDDTLNFTDDFMQTASSSVDPSAQPFPEPDQQTDLDRELERLAGERESAPTQVRPAVEPPDTGQAADREVNWETAASGSETLDFPSSDPSEIDFDLNLDESSIPSGSDDDETGLDTGDETPGKLNTGEGLLEFESENIPPEETWAGPSSDASPGGDDESLPYAPEDDVQSSGAPQYNEAETKLDLARAYLDMGDKVGARSIIDEVMREGDPAQRDRAAELASQL